MKALVTGGGGFLGRAVIEQLLTRGDEVRSLSRAWYPDLVTRGVELLQGDIAKPHLVLRAVEGTDVVFHVAAKAGVWGPPADFFRANVVGTENVIRACEQAGTNRLVYTSSPSVVFDGRDMEGVDESVPYAMSYHAHYPRTKALAEKRVLAANSDRLATVALRPHLLWGPNDTQLTKSILTRGRAGTLVRIGRRDPLVDFTYIENAALAHLLAADKLSPGAQIAGRVFFISQDQPVPIWSFVDRLLEAGSLPKVQRVISPGFAYAAAILLEFVYAVLPLKGEPRLTRFLAKELCTAHWFNIDAAKRELGYAPIVSIEEGLRRLRRSLLPV